MSGNNVQHTKLTCLFFTFSIFKKLTILPQAQQLQMRRQKSPTQVYAASHDAFGSSVLVYLVGAF